MNKFFMLRRVGFVALILCVALVAGMRPVYGQDTACIPLLKISCAFVAHEATIGALAFSPDGRYFATASSDLSVILWDASTGTKLRTLKGHRGEVWAAAFSPDGALLATGSHDRTIKIWEIPSGNLLMTLEGHLDFARTVKFSPDGSMLASGSWDHSIRLWRVASGRMTRMLVGHTDWVVSVDFSPDGKRLVSGSDDFSVRIWDVENGGLVNRMQGHTGNVWAVRFSPDGQRIISGSEDESIRVWDANTGTLVDIIEEHEGPIRSLAYSPDGEYFASGSQDGSIRVWDAASNQQIERFDTADSDVWTVDFSPDGDYVVSGACTRRNTSICREGEVRFDLVSGERYVDALTLDGFDSNQNNTIDDNEFFSIVDAWISARLSNALFFQAVDIWITSDPIRVEAPSELVVSVNLSELQSRLSRRAGGFVVSARGAEVESIQLEIFGLDGQRVYWKSSTNSSLFWDKMLSSGRRIANGVYFGVIEVRSVDGSLSREIRKLVLLR